MSSHAYNTGVSICTCTHANRRTAVATFFDEVIFGLVFRFALSFVLIFKHQKEALVCMLSRIGICASVLGGSLRYENAKQISLPALLWAKLLWAQWGVVRDKHNL